MNSSCCSLLYIVAGMCHDGVMFNNESILKSIARRVFPDMGAFSANGRARVGSWNADLCVGDEAAWLTVGLGRDFLFRIEVRGSRVSATYALPAVVTRADGAVDHSTEWANSRQWCVDGWPDVARASIEIKKFFDNLDEFLEAEKRVYEIIDGDKACGVLRSTANTR